MKLAMLGVVNDQATRHYTLQHDIERVEAGDFNVTVNGQHVSEEIRNAVKPVLLAKLIAAKNDIEHALSRMGVDPD